MTWTNPDRWGSPVMCVYAAVPSRTVTSPSNSPEVSAHHASCYGRTESAFAALSDSNRTNAMYLPSWVTPAVAPSQLATLGATAGVTQDGRYIALVRFESERAAKADSVRP